MTASHSRQLGALARFHFLDTEREPLLPVGELDAKSLAYPVHCKTGILGPCGRQRVLFARDRFELGPGVPREKGVTRCRLPNCLWQSLAGPRPGLRSG